jgi:hypothetical protein
LRSGLRGKALASVVPQITVNGKPDLCGNLQLAIGSAGVAVVVAKIREGNEWGPPEGFMAVECDEHDSRLELAAKAAGYDYAKHGG